MDEQIIEVDVAVVGAGGCGLTASLAAAEQGSRVILLESAPEAGGTTAMSVGIIIAAGSRLQKANGEDGTPEELAADILRKNGSQSDPSVTEALCRTSGALIDWLGSQGVVLEHMGEYRYPGMSRSWMLSPPRRQGYMMTEPLNARIIDNPNIDFRRRVKVTELIHDGASVSGLKAITQDGSRLAVHTQAVILAASGFGANPELVKRYLQVPATMAYYGSEFADGDAIGWGHSLGGVLDHMTAYQSHSSIAHPNLMLVTTYLINHGAIQVNQNGERFGNETDTYAGHAISVQSQPGQSVIELFDDRILRQTLVDFSRFEECVDAGIVLRADTLADLALQFELPAAALESSVEEYNRAVRKGRDQFGRTRFGQPLTSPYHAIRVTSAMVQTLGGLRVDSQARVLRSNDVPIPGLFAGGGTAAGLAGDRVEGYLAGAGLLAAFGLGWLAGRYAA